MDFVAIPNEHDVAWDQPQQLLPKENGVFGTQIASKGTYA